jgi:hypothetical protein
MNMKKFPALILSLLLLLSGVCFQMFTAPMTMAHDSVVGGYQSLVEDVSMMHCCPTATNRKVISNRVSSHEEKILKVGSQLLPIAFVKNTLTLHSPPLSDSKPVGSLNLVDAKRRVLLAVRRE